ncbi:MAG: lamin tail domain-containing protein [Alphaproteobacteria bacterium]|nr:lamin tail domain-containing protein [Alphaproteobacteria bacterium]
MRPSPLSPALLLVLAACAPGDLPQKMELSAVPPTVVRPLDGDGRLELYLTRPGTTPDGGEDTDLDDAIIELVEASTSTLDLALYEFDLLSVADAVVAAHERGVAVRFVGDGDELEAGDEGYLRLTEAGVPMSLRAPRDRIMHNKFVVADGSVVWTGSTNMSHNGTERNNNHSVLIESTELAAQFRAEFDQMADASFGRSKEDVNGFHDVAFRDQQVEFWFAPEHDPIDRLVALVDGAQRSVHFMIFSATHPDLYDALLRAQARGVEIVGVFDESQARGRYSIDESLAAAGIPVFIDGNQNASGFSGGKLHHKVLIVDRGTPDELAVSGSFNWSKNATENNDENLLVLRDPALVRMLHDEFCGVLEVATTHPDYLGPAPEPCVEATATVFINEFLPNPTGTDRGQEYVEIVNGSDVAVDLSGWTFGDEYDPKRHTFDDLILGPGEAVLLVDDEAALGQPGARLCDAGSLSLNNGGDTLFLATPDGAIVDKVEYGDNREGVSWNRSPDMGPTAPFDYHDMVEGSVGLLSPGTTAAGEDFGAEPAVPRIVINELLPNPAGTDLGMEFVELYNAGDAEAVLAGWTLSDLSGVRHEFTTETLAPGAVMVVYDRGDHSGVPGWINASSEYLSLNNTGDAMTLTEADGTVHDTVTWASSQEDVSWVRVEDGVAGVELVLHDGFGANSSPGTRSDGSAW